SPRRAGTSPRSARARSCRSSSTLPIGSLLTLSTAFFGEARASPPQKSVVFRGPHPTRLASLDVDGDRGPGNQPLAASPPSTLITLPLIQYVLGCASATIAAATSSGRVSLCDGFLR